MIRILHVVTYMGRGGLETMLMNYYRSIDRSKIQFDFLVHRDFRADYDDEIESLGGIIHRVPRLVPWSRTYKKSLEAFFKAHPEYKIVHVHQDCLSSVILKVADKCGVPIRLAHSHASSQDKNLKYLIKLFYMRSIPKYSTKMFACSKQAGDWMFRGSEFTVLNNAIDTNQYFFSDEARKKIRNEFGFSDDTFVLGHVGRFAPPKNHEFLIDIFYEVKKINRNSKLLLVGDGDLRQSITDKVDRLNLSDSVVLAGVRSDVHVLLNAMDAFVMPSVYEGLGIAIIEAQANGMHCIISDTIAKDCDLTDLVHRISLDSAPQVWAKQIISLSQKTREKRIDEIITAGYDIKENAKWLTEHYITLMEEIK